MKLGALIIGMIVLFLLADTLRGVYCILRFGTLPVEEAPGFCS